MDQQQEQDWFVRNWKWFVPVGFLGSLIVLACFVLLLITIIMGFLKSSDVYKSALEHARADSIVQEILGTPIEEGMFATGNIDISGSSGNADLAIPISGPNGKAKIYAVATKSAGLWTFSVLIVEIQEDRQRIDLLE